MNTLSFEPLDKDLCGFAGFRLLVDGAPIEEVPGCTFGDLSYWEIENDLKSIERDPNLEDCYRIIGVCDCGDAGCGNTHVRVVKSEQTVQMNDFSDRQPNMSDHQLIFSRANYEEVLSQMVELAKLYDAECKRWREQNLKHDS